MKRQSSERGAAAVEFAFILPVLLTLIIGMMEFGFLFNQQISATNAARAASRYTAVHYSESGFGYPAIEAAATTAAPSLNMVKPIGITYSTGTACAPGVTVTVQVQAVKGWLTGFLPFSAPQITGIGAMQCGG